VVRGERLRDAAASRTAAPISSDGARVPHPRSCCPQAVAFAGEAAAEGDMDRMSVAVPDDTGDLPDAAKACLGEFGQWSDAHQRGFVQTLMLRLKHKVCAFWWRLGRPCGIAQGTAILSGSCPPFGACS